MSRTHEFLWLDLETTGLDPRTCIPLEFGVVLAADDRDGDGHPVEQHQSVIAVGADLFSRGAFDRMDPYVRDMHTKNGLLEELTHPELCCSLEDADRFLAGLAGDGKPSLAGNSVHFDLSFIREHMPVFASKLSHRVFDVSTLLRCERTYGDSYAEICTKADAHRALPDALASLATWRAYRARRYS